MSKEWLPKMKTKKGFMSLENKIPLKDTNEKIKRDIQYNKLYSCHREWVKKVLLYSRKW